MKNTVFRNNNDQVSLGNLKIPFESLLPPEEQTNHPAIQGAELTFSCQFLAEIIRDAEDHQRLEDVPPKPQKPKKREFHGENGVMDITNEDEDTPREIRRALRVIRDIYYSRSFSIRLEYRQANAASHDLGLRAYAGGLHDALVRELDKAATSTARGLKTLNLRTNNHGHIGTKAAILQAHIAPNDHFNFSETKTSPFVVGIIYGKEQVDSRTKVLEYFQYTTSVWTILTIETDFLRSGAYRAGLKPKKKSRSGGKKGGEGDDKADWYDVTCRAHGVFRDNKGKALPGKLNLFLFPEKRTGTQAQDTMLTITYRELVDIVEKSEPLNKTEHPITEDPLSKRCRCYMVDENGNAAVEEEPKAKRSKVNDQQKTETTGRARPETAAANRPRRAKASQADGE
ncbi:hypothetical protein F4679DRAFT_592725 [Xylaria curta]|nr:hypothetical protein F4679DRAFT_592725 [Xylaria curta]